jgi:hypothetical protein
VVVWGAKIYLTKKKKKEKKVGLTGVEFLKSELNFYSVCKF